MSAKYPARGTLPSLAMGERDGDTLELVNQWARVTITREIEDTGEVFVCRGDLKDIRAAEMFFAKLRDAITYAMDSLAEYAKGAYR